MKKKLYLILSLLIFSNAFAAKVVSVNTNKIITSYTIVAKNIPINLNSFGHLSSKLFSNYSSETAGIIIEILFNAGDNVKKNDLLYKLNDNIPIAKLAQAQAQLNLAELDKNRYEKLKNQNVISVQDLDKVENTYQQAIANISLANAQLEQTRIKAPFAGVVGDSHVKLGDYVSPGKTLVTITNNEELELNYRVPDKYLDLLKKEQKVLFTVEAYPQQSFYGIVDYVSAYVDQKTHSVAVRATVSNKDLILFPGISAKITQQLKIEENAITVPSLALNADIEGYYVYVIEKEKALRRRVKTGEYLLNEVEVLSGLKIGEVIAVEGSNNLTQGDLVKIVK